MIVRALSVAAFAFGLGVLSSTFLPWATYELRASQLPRELAEQLPVDVWTATMRGWGSELRGSFIGLCAGAGAGLCLFALHGPRPSSHRLGLRPILYAACFFALALWMTVTARSMATIPARTREGGIELTAFLHQHHVGLVLSLVGSAIALGLSLSAAWMAWTSVRNQQPPAPPS